MVDARDHTAAVELRSDGYWEQSRRPLTSLVFVAPLLLIYELGILLLGPAAFRNGADVWLRQLLTLAGFGEYFLLPVLTVLILLGWHYTTRRPWRCSGRVLWGMACECTVLAVLLRIILQLQGRVFPAAVDPAAVAMAVSPLHWEWGQRLVGFLGAGVYEELLFRLILLSAMGWILRRLGSTPRASMAAAVLISSLLFAVAHYLGPHGEAIRWQTEWFWFSFLFRFVAGIFFGLLFVFRGFGIAAGTHAGYDILVGLL